MREIFLSSTKGILKPSDLGRKYELSRYSPSQELAPFIEYYWVVRWAMADNDVYQVETAPFPSVHITHENFKLQVYGVVTNRFSRKLEGKGQVFGVKFRPAMFFPFYQKPMKKLTDQVLSMDKVFGSSTFALNDCQQKEESHVVFAETFEIFLKQRNAKSDQFVLLARDITESVANNRTVVKVSQICSLWNISPRQLQRFFLKYVGVSPKWVIKRYRLQDAANIIGHDPNIDFAFLANELGYFDQAHFIRDFKSFIGLTPKQYAKDRT